MAANLEEISFMRRKIGHTLGCTSFSSVLRQNQERITSIPIIKLPGLDFGFFLHISSRSTYYTTRHSKVEEIVLIEQYNTIEQMKKQSDPKQIHREDCKHLFFCGSVALQLACAACRTLVVSF